VPYKSLSTQQPQIAVFDLLKVGLNESNDEGRPAFHAALRTRSRRPAFSANALQGGSITCNTQSGSAYARIAVLIESLSDPNINKIISGVEAIAGKAGYEIAILNVLGKESLRTGLDNFDGFIACYSDHAKLDLNFLDELGKPVVIVGNVENPGRYHCVSTDYRQGGQLAVNYLIDQGCQKIMMITAALTNTASDLEKYLGYRDALKKSGQALQEPWIVSESTIEAGMEIAAQMFEDGVLPEGIFVTNDWVAAGFIKFLKKAGSNIFAKTTVIGFGNESLCQMVEPDLCSIDFRKELAGSTALSLLVEQISSRNFSVGSKITIIEPALPVG